MEKRCTSNETQFRSEALLTLASGITFLRRQNKTSVQKEVDGELEEAGKIEHISIDSELCSMLVSLFKPFFLRIMLSCVLTYFFWYMVSIGNVYYRRLFTFIIILLFLLYSIQLLK